MGEGLTDPQDSVKSPLDLYPGACQEDKFISKTGDKIWDVGSNPSYPNNLGLSPEIFRPRVILESSGPTWGQRLQAWGMYITAYKAQLALQSVALSWVVANKFTSHKNSRL